MVRYFIFLIALLAASCDAEKQEPIKKTIYLTTNANDVYAFDIDQKKLKWHYPGFNLDINDEVNYFTIDDHLMTKTYQDGTLIQFDKNTGKAVWQMQDKEDETQSYYGYDFTNVQFLQFYQYPLVHQGNVIFGNSHGEIKSINIKTKKTNWVYIQPNIIYSSPKIIDNLLYANLNGSLIVLDLKNGKKISSVTYEENEAVTNEIMIDQGNIFTLSQNNTLTSRTPDLDLNWKYKADADSDQSGTFNLLFDEKNVYFGGGILQAIDKKNGLLRWKTTLYENGTNYLLYVAKSKDGLIVLTRNELLKLDKNGKITTRFKPKAEPMGMLYEANDLYYYVGLDGILYRIDPELKREEPFYKGIALDPEHRVDHTYMYGE